MYFSIIGLFEGQRYKKPLVPLLKLSADYRVSAFNITTEMTADA
jgi:hypothetical protein